MKLIKSYLIKKKNIFYLPFGYDQNYSKVINSKKINNLILFYGSWDKEREKKIKEINNKIIKIYGNGWEKADKSFKETYDIGNELAGKNLAEQISKSLICFSFVISKFRYSEDINPAIRMFKKSYEQIIGKGEERYEKHKKKLFSKVYIFSHDHHDHYTLSYRIFKDHPIMGTGPKGFRYLCRNKIYILENNDGCSTHPHNTYMQILTSNGIIGFTLLLFSFLS